MNLETWNLKKVTCHNAERWRFSACTQELNNILVPDFSTNK